MSVAAFLSNASMAFESPLKITSLSDLQGPLELLQKGSSPEKGLVIFDIDMTLTMNTNPAFHMSSFIRNRSWLKKFKASLDPDLWTLMMNLAITQTPNILIEPNAPELLKELQKAGYKTLALTAIFSGPLAKKESLEKDRHKELTRLGFNFNSSFEDILPFSLTNIPPYRGHHPVFFKGILCANLSSAKSPHKGDILVAFLEKTGINPDYILFIDDKLQNCLDIEESLKKVFPEIRYIGLHYTGAMTAFPEIKTSQKDLEIEIKHLMTQAQKTD